MRDRGRVRILLVVLAAAMTMGTRGCLDPVPSYPPPPPPLRPNFAGVIDKVERSSDGWLLTMTDGRTLDEVQEHPDTVLLGSPPQPGLLTLASTVTPKFVDNLGPIGSEPGCWDPWLGQPEWNIAWNMGDSILFSYGGLELPKAPDYHSDVPTEDIDGRQAWTTGVSLSQTYMVCANSSGQIEWFRLTS